MTEIEPSKKFGFSETAEMKEEKKTGILGFPYIPPNDNQETVLQMLKREKEEDKEFYRMICIQEKRRLERNPHLKTGTFGPGTGTKSLYQKIQDLLKDYYYPENEFNRLKLDVILAEKQLEEAQEELQKAEKEISALKKEREETADLVEKMNEQVKKMEKQVNEITDEADRMRTAYLEATMPEHENLYVSGEDYKKLSCEKWLLQEELQEVKDKIELMETDIEKIEDRKEELERQLTEKENEQQNLEKRALEEELKEAKEKIERMETEISNCINHCINNTCKDELKEAKEKISLLENELRNLKQDDKENTNIFGEILGEVLKDFSEKNPSAAWMEPELSRESWSIYIEPNDATDARFRSLKELFTEHCHKFCFVKNGKTNNISGEIQLKKPLNFDQLRDLLGPNIYLNGGPKEEATEKWSMAAKFNEKDYFSIYFTDEAQKNCEIQK